MKGREGAFLLDEGRVFSETERIVSLIEKSEEFLSSSCVLSYMALAGEVSLDALFKKWRGRKRFVLPRVIGASEMELREYSLEALAMGYKGILEPSEEALKVDAEEVDFALIPGVAFSKSPDGEGFLRLGRGKGYYDRFLPGLSQSCTTAGVCFPFRLEKEIPSDPCDRPVDMLFF